MSHDPNNKDCPKNTPVSLRGLLEDDDTCTCPPAVDGVEQIRQRHNSTLFTNWGYSSDAQPHSLANAEQCHADREALLRIVDQLRAGVDKTTVDCARTVAELTGELAAAQSELERVRAENEHLKGLLRRYRNEVPTGNQPHMIVHHVDEALQEPTK